MVFYLTDTNRYLFIHDVKIEAEKNQPSGWAD